MDDIVRQAIARWPNVPDCYGWLGLDARGDWYLRDEAAQALVFAGGPVGARGSPIRHAKLIEFIGRNYEADAAGRWFSRTARSGSTWSWKPPWVLRVTPELAVHTHTGRPVVPQGCLLDESGRLYLSWAGGLGVVHSQDMVHAVEAVESGSGSPRTAAPTHCRIDSATCRTPVGDGDP